MSAPPLPHTPSNSHFVRRVKLRLAYRLAFVKIETNKKIQWENKRKAFSTLKYHSDPVLLVLVVSALML